MPKRLRPEITFANVVSCLALFVALGSGAYAATHLPKNSVGTKQLKGGAVTKQKVRKDAINGPKVKNNSLTGADINLNKLGTVPSASNAATANTASTANLANSIPPAEPTHLVGAPGEPGFEGGSGNAAGAGGINLQPVGFYRDHEGIVHLQGLTRLGSEGLLKIFTLPEGYRPANNIVLYYNVLCISENEKEEPCQMDGGEDAEKYSLAVVAGSNVSEMGQSVGGGVIVFSGPNRLVSLEGITFRAES